jgi:hypothetical protein
VDFFSRHVLSWKLSNSLDTMEVLPWKAAQLPRSQNCPIEGTHLKSGAVRGVGQSIII